MRPLQARWSRTQATGPNSAVSVDLGPVRWFAERARRGGDIAKLLEEACRALGIAYFALIHHGDLHDHPPGSLALVNYPSRWRDHYIAHELFRIDPVLKACRRMLIGFDWSRLDQLITMTPRQRAMFHTCRKHGLGRGFTVPIHLPGEREASCSFAVERGAPFPAETMLATQLLGQLAFEAARPLADRGTALSPPLSPRQREVVRLMAGGLPDRGIAREMNLSEETVTKYANAARRRYGLARRTQLVAAALHHGEIGFSDVIKR
jgi:LuxR family quorum-sensing system transcriptional regulator CciR